MVEHSGRRFVLEPEHLYLIPATVPHSVSCDSSLRVRFVHFTLRVLGGLSLFQLTEGRHERVPESVAEVRRDLAGLKGSGEALLDQGMLGLR